MRTDSNPCIRDIGKEDTVDDAEPTPADEPVANRRVRSAFGRSILPAQAVVNHVEDTADPASILNTRHLCERGK